MKTDLEKFQELYSSLGIELVVVKFTADTGDELNLQRVTLCSDGLQQYASPGQTCSEKFEGYGGFESTIDFDQNGKFVKQGFWE